MGQRTKQTFLQRRKGKGILKMAIYLSFSDYTKAFDWVAHKNLWKILKDVGIFQTTLPISRTQVYTGQEVPIRTGHGTMDWFKIGKEVHQGCII